MKEYKVVSVRGIKIPVETTQIMNEYAAMGWTVKSTCATSEPHILFITFERDKQE